MLSLLYFNDIHGEKVLGILDKVTSGLYIYTILLLEGKMIWKKIQSTMDRIAMY